MNVKGMNQKIVLLQYEQNLNLANEKVKMDQEVVHSSDSNQKIIDDLKLRLLGFEAEQIEQKAAFQRLFAIELLNNDKTRSELKEKYELRIKELDDTLKGKIKSVYYANELELKSKLQFIEDKFNLQIKTLIENHEKSMLDMKAYFNELVQNEITLIEGLKEQLHDSHSSEEKSKRQLNLLATENKNMKKPLESFKLENEKLKKEILVQKRQIQSIRVDQAKSFHQEEENLRIIDENTILKSNLLLIKQEWDATRTEYNKKLATFSK